MELTKQSISNYKTLIPGIEGYMTVVSKIENNVTSNPDIAIESCKSLIEGLCLKALSLLSDKYNSSKSTRTSCKNDLSFLTHFTFDEIYSDYVESQIHKSLSNMVIDISVANKIKENAKRKVKGQAVETIAKVSAVRNERGDISHGRNYPKKQESSIKLAQSINSITDGICSFMIEEFAIQYKEKYKIADKLVYDDLEEFNIWLEDLHNISSVKVDFSKLLFQNAYEKYVDYYYLEYLPSTENIDDIIEIEEDLKTSISSIINSLKDYHKVNNEIIEKNKPKLEINPKLKITISNLIKQLKNKSIENLVSTFDEIKFWTKERQKKLSLFAQEKEIYEDKLKDIIENYIAFDKEPLRDDIANALINRPSLAERRSKVLNIQNDIALLVEELKNKL